MSASLYPLFLNLQGRTCIVIGGNDVAEAKVRELLNAKAVIRLIAPTVTEQISAWSREEKLCWESRSYRRGDLQDAFLVVSVADAETNAIVFQEVEARHILCNAVDDIPHCNRRGTPLSLANRDFNSGKEPGPRAEIAKRTGRTIRPRIYALGTAVG